MGLFNRTKRSADDDAVPDEIKDYYQAEKRDRMWVVWFLSAATFVVTVFVVLGLFWGGRWVYREIKGDDKDQTVATQEDASDQENINSQGTHTDSSNDSSTQQQTPATTTPAQPQPDPTPQQTTPTTTPTTGPTTPEVLPATGPSSDE